MTFTIRHPQAERRFSVLATAAVAAVAAAVIFSTISVTTESGSRSPEIGSSDTRESTTTLDREAWLARHDTRAEQSAYNPAADAGKNGPRNATAIISERVEEWRTELAEIHEMVAAKQTGPDDPRIAVLNFQIRRAEARLAAPNG